jgi:hypothetical protein
MPLRSDTVIARQDKAPLANALFVWLFLKVKNRCTDDRFQPRSFYIQCAIYAQYAAHVETPLGVAILVSKILVSKILGANLQRILDWSRPQRYR